MNPRHDQTRPAAQVAPVVAQSSRAHSSIAAQLCFRAHIFKSSQVTPVGQASCARLFFKPGHTALGGQTTPAGHIFNAARCPSDPIQFMPRFTYGQPRHQSASRSPSAGLIFKSRPGSTCSPGYARRGVLLREPLSNRGPALTRSRSLYRASQKPSGSHSLDACAHLHARPSETRVPFAARRAHLPVAPNQHDQEGTWTSTQ
jgi:hypothetical protein